MVNLNRFFLEKRADTIYQYFLNGSVLSRASFLGTALHVLHYERLNHHKNSMTGYCNTKNLQSKFIDLKVILKYLSLG